jgi:hypothetical protein
MNDLPNSNKPEPGQIPAAVFATGLSPQPEESEPQHSTAAIANKPSIQPFSQPSSA